MASASRFLAGLAVDSESSSRCAASVTSPTARSNAASLARDGWVKPESLRTNCRAEAWISSSVAGGSKLNSVRILRHIGFSNLVSVGRISKRSPPTDQYGGLRQRLSRPTCAAARGLQPAPRNDEWIARLRSHERLDAGLRAAEDERMDIVRAFVGVDGLEIAHHAHDVKLIGDAVATVHVASEPRHFQRLAAIVALEHRDRRRGCLALVDQPRQAQCGVQAERDLGLHVGELLLHELIGGERPAELLAREHVIAGTVPAEFGGADRAPGDAGARDIEAAERPGEARDVRQQVILRHDRAVE